jgi:hypothetical protein
MLPIGTLAPHPGFGPARPSRLTMDEQRTLLTLQAIARSPLILGANLTRLDDATRALITNKDVIAVNQSSRENHPVTRLPKGFDHVRVWVASGRSDGERYLAIFNLDDKPVSLHAPWGELGLASGGYDARDLWSGQPRKVSARLSRLAGARMRAPVHEAGTVRHRQALLRARAMCRPCVARLIRSTPNVPGRRSRQRNEIVLRHHAIGVRERQVGPATQVNFNRTETVASSLVNHLDVPTIETRGSLRVSHASWEHTQTAAREA